MIYDEVKRESIVALFSWFNLHASGFFFFFSFFFFVCVLKSLFGRDSVDYFFFFSLNSIYIEIWNDI